MTKTTTNIGIDYGNGLTNVNHDSGIRYGVIHHHEVGQRWYEDSEGDYGEPTCGKCGNTAPSSNDADSDLAEREWFDGKDFYCPTCEYCFWSDDAYSDEPRAHTFEDDEYSATQGGDDCDIFVLKSPYYTHAQYCSPCAPGAVYLMSETDTNGPRGYCFGHEWFEEGKAPYPVYKVEDDSEVKAETT